MQVTYRSISNNKAASFNGKVPEATIKEVSGFVKKYLGYSNNELIPGISKSELKLNAYLGGGAALALTLVEAYKGRLGIAIPSGFFTAVAGWMCQGIHQHAMSEAKVLCNTLKIRGYDDTVRKFARAQYLKKEGLPFGSSRFFALFGNDKP